MFISVSKLARITLFAGILAMPSLGKASSWTISKADSPVTFVAVGKPGFLKIHGEGASLTGTATVDNGKLAGSFIVDLKDLKTGIDLRDEHMKTKYLEVDKFPQATLKIAQLNVKPGENDVSFDGILTIKGTSKPVTGKLTLSLLSDSATGSANFDFKITDFPEIGVPSHLGVTVAEKVEVALKFSAKAGPAS